jgi:hypothetical protein
LTFKPSLTNTRASSSNGTENVRCSPDCRDKSSLTYSFHTLLLFRFHSFKLYPRSPIIGQVS